MLAHHPGTDPALTDHRDPGQWLFHGLASADLPAQRRIGLTALTRLTKPVMIDAIGAAVDTLAQAG